MKTTEEFEDAFTVYFTEMDRCENAKCYWALLHLAVVIPDICGALEFGSDVSVGTRYTGWCKSNLPVSTSLTPVDRYQLRCALLHEGSTLPATDKSQYSSISFVEPGATNVAVHMLVSDDGKNVAINVKEFADEIRCAVRSWFESLQADAARNSAVEQNLPKLARLQTKTSQIPITTSDGHQLFTSDGHLICVELRYQTTSST